MTSLTWLDPNTVQFPDTHDALEEPNGLLAAGGALTPEWLIHAYSHGIFPWFSDGEPILWWSPSPRTMIYIDHLHVSRSLRKAINKHAYNVTFDTAFADVINACSQPRQGQKSGETWITEDMMNAYNQLHQMGYAHSVEVWDNDRLVGGLYGIALGRVFFGESMFSFQTNCSKIALYHLEKQLKQWQYVAIDCQVHNDHLCSLGAVEIERNEFEVLITQHIKHVDSHWLK